MYELNVDSMLYTFGAEYDIPDMEATSIAVDYTGTVWAGTVSGVAYMPITDTLWTALAENNNLVHSYVTDIVPMNDFSIWFGTKGGVSIKSLQGWTSYTIELGPSAEVTSIWGILVADWAWYSLPANHGSAADNKWVSTTNGISVFDGENWTLYGSEVLPSTYVNVVYKDSGGNVWCGTSVNAVAYDGKLWVEYGQADGLTAFGINDFAQDSSGILWTATDGGVFYLSNNKWYEFSLPEEVTSAAATVVAVDKRSGALWIGTVSGAVRYTIITGE